MWGCTFQPLGRPALPWPPCLWLTLCKRLVRLSPNQARWEAQWAERMLTVALVWAQASCKPGLTTASRWEPQAGNVSSSQLWETMGGERKAEFPQMARLPKNSWRGGEGRPWEGKSAITSH